MATVITIVNYDRTVIMIVNYNPKTFIVQATALSASKNFFIIKLTPGTANQPEASPCQRIRPSQG